MIVFDNIDIKQRHPNKITVKNIKRGLLYPRAVSMLTTGLLGARLGKVSRNPRPISCTLRIVGTLAERRAIARDLASVFDKDDVAPLYFTDEPNKVYYAVLTGEVDFDESARVLGEIDLNFICPDPYAYGVAVSQAITNGGEIINNGSAPALPKFTATFTAPAASADVSIGGKMVRVIRNFVAGDVLVVDSNDHSVKVNSVLAMPALTFDSIFPVLGSGANTIGFSSGMTMRIDYVERWK